MIFSKLVQYMMKHKIIHHAISDVYGSKVHHSSLYSMIIGSSTSLVVMPLCKV